MILIGTDDGLFLWRTNFAAPERFGPAGVRITSIAATGTGRFYAVADKSRLLVGDPQEGVLDNAGDGFEGAPTCVATHGGEEVYVGTEPPAVYRLDASDRRWKPIGLLHAMPFAAGWSSPSGQAAVRSLAPNPNTRGALYADIHVGGIVRTLDGGLTWEPVAEGLEEDVHQVVTTPTRPDYVYAATADGFYRSRSEGDRWQKLNSGLENLYCRAVAVHPVCPEIILISGSPTSPGGWGTEGKRFALFRSDDAAKTWSRVAHGIPPEMPEEVDTFCLIFSDHHPDHAYCARRDGIIYFSPDTGLTWEEKFTGLPPIRALAAA